MQRERAVLCRELGAGSRAVQAAGRRRELGAGSRVVHGAGRCSSWARAGEAGVQGATLCRIAVPYSRAVQAAGPIRERCRRPDLREPS